MLIVRNDDETVCPMCFEELFNEQDPSSHKAGETNSTERCTACGLTSSEVDKALTFDPSEFEYDGSLMGFDPYPNELFL